jgi:hypothetical protein
VGTGKFNLCLSLAGFLNRVLFLTVRMEPNLAEHFSVAPL